MNFVTHILTAVVVFAGAYVLGSQTAPPSQEERKPKAEVVEAAPDAEKPNEGFEKLKAENAALRKVLGERNKELALLQSELTELKETQAKALLMAKGGEASNGSLSSASEDKALADGEADSDEDGPKEEEVEGATPLLTSMMKMKGLRGDRHLQWRIDRKMNDALGDLELPEEQKSKVSDLLKNYYEKTDELGLLALDPNVPPEEVLMKAKALHEESLNSLSLEVDMTKAQELLSNSQTTEERGVENLQRAFGRMKLNDEQKLALESAAQNIVQTMPELGLSMGSHRSSSTIGPNTTWEEVDMQRQFVSGVDTVSGLIKKSLELRQEGQDQLLASLAGNENFDEETLSSMKKASERSQERYGRWVGMVEAMENDPDVIESMKKLRDAFGTGRSSGR